MGLCSVRSDLGTFEIWKGGAFDISLALSQARKTGCPVDKLLSNPSSIDFSLGRVTSQLRDPETGCAAFAIDVHQSDYRSEHSGYAKTASTDLTAYFCHTLPSGRQTITALGGRSEEIAMTIDESGSVDMELRVGEKGTENRASGRMQAPSTLLTCEGDTPSSRRRLFLVDSVDCTWWHAAVNIISWQHPEDATSTGDWLSRTPMMARLQELEEYLDDSSQS